LGRSFNPKNNGPDQRLPVITRATSESDRYGLPRKHRAALQHRHLMLGAAPLADQKRSRCESARGRDCCWPPDARIPGRALEQSARGRLESANDTLLHTVRDRTHQQIAAEARRASVSYRFFQRILN